MTSPTRINKLSFVYPFSIGGASYIMPTPDSSQNMYALLKPFNLWVSPLIKGKNGV